MITSFEKIKVIGEKGQSGTYILRIDLRKNEKVVFGKFKKGKQIALVKGEYLYIGSALAKKGATTLGNRLQRHTSRSKGQSHLIKSALLKFFEINNIHFTKNPHPKTLYWNVDHLLDLMTAQITNIIFTRSNKRLEDDWSRFLEEKDYSSIFEKGLGANDSPGHTHLQRTTITNKEWNDLVNKLPI